jgi:hypothetical protein
MYDTLESSASSTSFVNLEAQQAVQPHLGPGERLVWAGRPRQGIFFQPADAFMVPFSMAWGGFAIFWTLMAYRSGAPWFFVLWGLPFVCVGLWLMVGRFFTDAGVRAKTYYAVTDKRVLFVKAGRTACVTGVDIRSVGDVTLAQHRNGRGSILFGAAIPNQQAARMAITFASRNKSAMIFNQIERAKEVYDQIFRLKENPR